MSAPVEKPGIEVLRALFASWHGAKIAVAVLNGMEDFPERVGRDIDLQFHPKDGRRARESAARLLEERGWRVGVYELPAIGMDQLFALRKDDLGGETWIEIDFIYDHPISWRCQEMLEIGLESRDLIDVRGLPIYPWAWFVKNVLVQLLVGDAAKFERKLAILERWSEPLVPRILDSAESRHLGRAVRVIIEGMMAPARDFSKLRAQVSHAVWGRLWNPALWPTLLGGVGRALRRIRNLHFPTVGCVPKLHVFARDREKLDHFAKALASRVQELYPFCDAKVRLGRAVRQSADNLLARWLDLRRGGWNRQLRDSSWLVLRIETWLVDGTEPEEGDAITAGDLRVSIDPSSESMASVQLRGSEAEMVREACEHLTEAFFQNLGAGRKSGG